MAWSVPCRCLQNIHISVEQYPAMKKIQVLFHDAGGGHRNAAVALQTVISHQSRGWQVELVQFQELTDHLDVLRKLTGIRIQEQYNTLLRTAGRSARRNCCACSRPQSAYSIARW